MEMAQETVRVAHLIRKNQQDILQKWVSYQVSSANWRADLMKESDLRQESREFLDCFIEAAQQNGTDTDGPAWKPIKEMLRVLSRSRALQGFSPSETAIFVLSPKQPVFGLLQREITEVQELTRQIWLTTMLLDRLGLYTTEFYQQSRDSIIARQQ